MEITGGLSYKKRKMSRSRSHVRHLSRKIRSLSRKLKSKTRRRSPISKRERVELASRRLKSFADKFLPKSPRYVIRPLYFSAIKHRYVPRYIPAPLPRYIPPLPKSHTRIVQPITINRSPVPAYHPRTDPPKRVVDK